MSRALTKHGWTNERYFLTHGEKFMPKEWEKAANDPKYGNAGVTGKCLECGDSTRFMSSKWTYPNFCGFSCSTAWHAKHTDRVAMAGRTIKKRKAADPDFQLGSVNARYWVKRGYSEEEAAQKVRERQATVTPDRFIARYGEEEGLRRFAERNEKWLKSLGASGMHSGFSSVGTELFEKVAEKCPGIEIRFGETEEVIRVKRKAFRVDCLAPEKNKIIEFNGDYWHANPRKYSPDHDIRGMPAQKIWERDKARNEALKEAGYSVLVVWEHDFRTDPEGTLGRCVGFLAS